MEVMCPPQVVSDPSVPPTQCSVSSSLNCETAHLCIQYKLNTLTVFKSVKYAIHVLMVYLHVAVYISICIPNSCGYRCLIHTYRHTHACTDRECVTCVSVFAYVTDGRGGDLS